MSLVADLRHSIHLLSFSHLGTWTRKKPLDDNEWTKNVDGKFGVLELNDRFK